MVDLNTLSQLIGIPLWLLAVYFIWELVWKCIAMWKAARRNSPTWFVVLLLVNSGGILSILYVYLFSEMKFDEIKDKKSPKKRKKRK